jgi:glycerophosphoryl diester phosphodiesterase
MEGSAYLEAKGKLGVHHSKESHHANVVIPTSTPTCVIVKALKIQVDKPRGTIKLKTQMDTAFSIFLRGKCSEEEFRVRFLSIFWSHSQLINIANRIIVFSLLKHTIDGINWFANLLHEAEVEFYAEAYSSSVAWKDYHAELSTEEQRQDILQSYAKENLLAFKRRRPRITSDAQMKDYLNQVVTALHHFIDDENNRVYLVHGVQWHYPEKNHWRWLEIQILPDGSDKPSPPTNSPAFEPPKAPVLGETLKFEVLDTLQRNDHSEYVVHVSSNLPEWYPLTDTFMLRRFNDFKEFYNTLNEYMEEHQVEIGMPCVPDGSFIGRYEEL